MIRPHFANLVFSFTKNKQVVRQFSIFIPSERPICFSCYNFTMYLELVLQRAVGAGGAMPPSHTQIISGLNPRGHITPTTLLPLPPDFQTSLRPCFFRCCRHFKRENFKIEKGKTQSYKRDQMPILEVDCKTKPRRG